MSSVYKSTSCRLPWWFWLPLLLALAGNVAGWLSLGALPDEAYYWVWSQRLQAGYYDHPPLVAWLIRPFASLFDNAIWAIRLPAVASWGVGAAVGYALAARIFRDRRAGLLALLVWSTLPAVQVGFHIVTPDAPLVIFAWLTYYFVVRALQEARHGWWLLAGACAGLTVLGKYTGALVPVGILIALLSSRPGRTLLAQPGPWLAAAASLAAFAPVVVWNWQHDWISFAFQFSHGVADEVAESPWVLLGVFLAGQLAMAAPWTWGAMAYAGLRGGRVPPGQPLPVRHVLQVGFWLPLLVFAAAGLTTEGHPNWPVTAYLPGSVLLAGILVHWLWPAHRVSPSPATGRMAAVTSLALASVLLINLMRFPHWLAWVGIDLPPQRTQLSQSYGWDEVGRELRAQLARHEYGDRCTVLGDRLQTASMVGLLLGDAYRVGVPNSTRFNQFHLWQGEQPPGDACLLVRQFDKLGAVRESIGLAALGRWRRFRLLEVETPDRMRRWFAFYTPADTGEGRHDVRPE